MTCCTRGTMARRVSTGSQQLWKEEQEPVFRDGGGPVRGGCIISTPPAHVGRQPLADIPIEAWGGQPGNSRVQVPTATDERISSSC